MQHDELVDLRGGAADELGALRRAPLMLAGMFVASLAMLSCMMTTFGLAFGVPVFAEIFIDFDTELPGLTVMLMNHYMKLAVLAGAMTVAVPISSMTIKDPRPRAAIALLLCLAGMSMLAVLVIGLFLPLAQLITSVSR